MSCPPLVRPALPALLALPGPFVSSKASSSSALSALRSSPVQSRQVVIHMQTGVGHHESQLTTTRRVFKHDQHWSQPIASRPADE